MIKSIITIYDSKGNIVDSVDINDLCNFQELQKMIPKGGTAKGKSHRH